MSHDQHVYHKHPKCATCLGLVDDNGKTLNQPPVGALVVLCKRIQTSIKLHRSMAQRDVGLLVLDTEEGFALLEETARPGEPLDACAKRIVMETTGIEGQTTRSISCHGHVGRGSDRVAVLHCVSCDTAAQPMPTLQHHNASFIELSRAIDLVHSSQFVNDHGEAVLAFAAWIGDKIRDPEQAHRFFAKTLNYPIKTVTNPVFGKPNGFLNDSCFKSWSNPHFKSAILKPPDHVLDELRRAGDSRYNAARPSTFSFHSAEVTQESITDTPRAVRATAKVSMSQAIASGAVKPRSKLPPDAGYEQLLDSSDDDMGDDSASRGSSSSASD
eukprot:m.363275 g.363275  ORF g.363275 m.363275 type:complete len:328 (+) comp21852_c0_seq1:114-1097(+)